jgi:hypothetical protein
MNEKYVLIDAKTSDVDSRNDWYRHCQTNVFPYITITEKAEYATVEWDHINLPMGLDDKISENRARLMEGFESIYHKYANLRSEKQLHFNGPRFIDIEVANSKLLASDLYDFVAGVLDLSQAPPSPDVL